MRIIKIVFCCLLFTEYSTLPLSMTNNLWGSSSQFQFYPRSRDQDTSLSSLLTQGAKNVNSGADPDSSLIPNDLWPNSLRQSLTPEAFEKILSVNGEDWVKRLLEMSLSDSFTFCHLMTLLDSKLYDDILAVFDLSQFPLDTYQVQTTIVKKETWRSRFGHVSEWPLETLKFFQNFFIRGFTISTLMDLQIPLHSPANIIALLNEPNSKSIATPELCRYLFYLEKLYNFQSRYYRKPITGRIQNCLNNEYLLTATLINPEVVNNVPLTWYQFHLILMTQPKIDSTDTNIIRHFSIKDLEISQVLVRKIVSSQNTKIPEMTSPLSQEFLFQSTLYGHGNELFHYQEKEVALILNFLDMLPLKSLFQFRNVNINAALSSRPLTDIQSSSFSKKKILLEKYKAGQFSNVKLTLTDVKNLRWVLGALSYSDVNSIPRETLPEVMRQFDAYPEHIPTLSRFIVLKRIMLTGTADEKQEVVSSPHNQMFSYWISQNFPQLSQNWQPGILNEQSARLRCAEVTRDEVVSVGVTERLAILSVVSNCKPSRGRSQWILEDIRTTIFELYGSRIVNFSLIPGYYEAAFSGEIWRELTADELQTIPDSLCANVFSKISGSSFEFVPQEMGKKLVDVYMNNCVRRTYLSDMDLAVLGPMVCYASSEVLKSSQRQLIFDNLYLFHNCCFDASVARVIKGHVLKASVFSRSVIRSLGPSYPLIVEENQIEQLENMSSFLMNYILSDLSTVVRQGLPHQCESTPQSSKIYSAMVHLVKDKLIRSTKSMKGCSDRKFGSLTCPIIKEIGKGMKEIPARELESMSSCDIEICVNYFGNSDYITDEQMEVFKTIYISTFKILGTFSGDTMELGKVLTKFNTEELQISVSKLQDMTDFAQLGKIRGWSDQQLKIILNIFKAKFNLTSSSSNQNKFSPDHVFAMGNIFCGATLSEIYQWIVTFDEKLRVIQFLGALQCSENWFQDMFQLFKTMSRDPAGVVAMGNIALGFSNPDGSLDSLTVDQIQKLIPEFLSKLNEQHLSKLRNATSFFRKLSPEQISGIKKRGRGFPEGINMLMERTLIGHDSYQLSSSYHLNIENEKPEKRNDVTEAPVDSQNSDVQYEYQSQYSNVVYIFASSLRLSINLNIVTYSIIYSCHNFFVNL